MECCNHFCDKERYFDNFLFFIWASWIPPSGSDLRDRTWFNNGFWIIPSVSCDTKYATGLTARAPPGGNPRALWAEFSTLSWAVIVVTAPRSRVENSAQVSSCVSFSLSVDLLNQGWALTTSPRPRACRATRQSTLSCLVSPRSDSKYLPRKRG
jgi:hypothetical protein